VGVLNKYADIELAETIPPPARCAATSPASGRGEEKFCSASLTLRFQFTYDLVELIEITVADVNGAAGLAVVDANS
jgi:hypothetical protein